MFKLFKQQPKAFYVIWILEYWERFAYYALQSVLVLYFINFLKVDTQVAYYIFGAFAALIYGMNALGGYLGDHVLGVKRTLLLGLFVLAAGYFALAFANKDTIFYALALICVGNGLFKANPASLLSKCYTQDDKRLHGAFALYYMAINFGSIMAILLGPNIGAYFGYRITFFISGLGILVACLTYQIKYEVLVNLDSSVGRLKVSWFKLFLVCVGIVFSTIFCAYLLHHVWIARNIVVIIALVTLLIYLLRMAEEDKVVQIRMMLVLFLMLEATLFFALYFQMPTSLNLFAVQHIRHNFFGFNVDPQSFQIFNPIWIVVLGPILANLDFKLRDRGYVIHIPYKFALGMCFCGLSFLVLYASHWFSSSNYTINVWWLIFSYFFQGMSELLVSALGIAMIAELAPSRMTGFVTGMWFLTSSLGSFIAAKIASYTATTRGLHATSMSFDGYINVFGIIGFSTLGVAALLWLLAPRLSKLVGSNDNTNVVYPG